MNKITPWTDEMAQAALRRLFDAAVHAADPLAVLADHLPDKPRGRCIVVGAGKAAARMAQAVEAAWPDVALSGAVVTRYGQGAATSRIAVLEASHPKPDAASERAARHMLSLVSGLGPDDLVLALMSGGGSALLCAPAPGLTLADKQAVTTALLASGATISEMNLVRRQLSAIKGGRLAAAAWPARVVTLAISDIPGDAPADIASGPTVREDGPRGDARAILRRYGIEPSPAVATVLTQAGRPQDAPARADAPAPQDVRLVATPALSLTAAAAAARNMGLTPLILGDALQGESRGLGVLLAGIAASVRRHGWPLGAPAVILSGGETTVTIGKGPAGQGGRNTECMLGFAIEAAGQLDTWALACDTDGIDGESDAAGATVTPSTVRRAQALGLDPHALLAGHDSYRLFDQLGDLIRCGPTMTNVNDFRAVLVI